MYRVPAHRPGDDRKTRLRPDATTRVPGEGGGMTNIMGRIGSRTQPAAPRRWIGLGLGTLGTAVAGVAAGLWQPLGPTTAAGALALVSLLAIWVAYGLRFRATAAGEADFPMMVPGDYGQPPPRTPAESWEVVLHDPSTGSDRRTARSPTCWDGSFRGRWRPSR